jgi:hypothetical protein
LKEVSSGRRKNGKPVGRDTFGGGVKIIWGVLSIIDSIDPVVNLKKLIYGIDCVRKGGSEIYEQYTDNVLIKSQNVGVRKHNERVEKCRKISVAPESKDSKEVLEYFDQRLKKLISIHVEEKFNFKKTRKQHRKLIEKKLKLKKERRLEIASLTEKVFNKNIKQINQSLRKTKLARLLFWFSYIESLSSRPFHGFAKTASMLREILFSKERRNLNETFERINKLIQISNSFELHQEECMYKDLLEHVVRTSQLEKADLGSELNFESVFGEQVQVEVNSVLDTARDGEAFKKITKEEFDSQEECDEYLTTGLTKMERNLGIVSKVLQERLYPVLFRNHCPRRIQNIEDQLRSQLVQNFDWIQNILNIFLANLFEILKDNSSVFWIRFNANLFEVLQLRRKRIKYEHLYRVYSSVLK